MQIVILSFNHPDITRRCIKSVLPHALQHNVRPLLVHNGSQKRNEELLRHEFPQIDHLSLSENQGFSGGANAGLSHCANKFPEDWILFLTNDCQLLELNPPTIGHGIVAPLLWARKQGRVDSMGGCLDPRSLQLRHCHNPTDFTEAKLGYIPGTAFWIHPRALQKLGGFDTSLGTYWEDVDLSLRAKILQVAMRFEADTQILHAIGKTCHKLPFYTSYLYQRNRRTVLRRHRSLLAQATSYFTWMLLLQIEFGFWRNFTRQLLRGIKVRDFSKVRLLTQAWRDS